jgi:hypothetical protein
VLAEALDVAAHRLREIVGPREPDAVLRRHDHGGGEAGEGEVRGREAVAAEVAAAVGAEAGVEPARERFDSGSPVKRRSSGGRSRSA